MDHRTNALPTNRPTNRHTWEVRGALSHLKTEKQGRIQGNVSRGRERNTSRNSCVTEIWLKQLRARD